MKINEKNLCMFATTPPYDIEGFLYKRGEINKAFQRRYFVLKGNLLFYFEKRGDKEPLGLIIVEGCTIELSQDLDNNYCFEIKFIGNRTYVLAAETHEKMEAWMKALASASYEYKRAVLDELQRQLDEIEEVKNKMTKDRKATTMQSNSYPKPPPRRQNPFNRPAPLPPNEAKVEQGIVVSPMPFINGHFGSSSARRDQILKQQQLSAGAKAELEHFNGNNTPKAPKRVVTPAGRGSTATRALTAAQRRRRDIVAEEFARSHEHYAHDVMKDINEYRAKKMPLVEL